MNRAFGSVLLLALLVSAAWPIASGSQPLSQPDDEVPLGGNFSPPHDDVGLDEDDNGLYDFLVMIANITVDTEENYTVAGNLYKEGTSLFLFNSTSLFLEPGDHSVRIFFDGPSINSSGVDGPYSVGLFLWDAFRNPLDTALYTTHQYNHTDFDPVAAEFAPPHADAPLDSDADGRFNVLNVNASVSVHTAAQYHVNAFLTDANFTLSMSESATVTLDPGPRTVTLPFAGDRLNASGVNGPYFVTMTLFILPTFVPIDHGEHVTEAYNYTQFEEPTVLASAYAPAPPEIDGTISEAEWRSAREVNLSTIPGNDLPAFLLVMNDDSFLYVAYDAVGDMVLNGRDIAATAFDTGNDERAAVGDEDEFVQGGWAQNNQAHYVFYGDEWNISDSPFNPNLPNQAGLAGNWSFGPSPKSGSDHRTYEFQIPLSLLGALPGDVLGFSGGSHLAPPAPFAGVFDEETSGYSTWPIWTDRSIPLRGYGDLVLAQGEGDTVRPTIEITSPASPTIVTTDSVTVTWDASDADSGIDRIEVQVDGGPITTLPSTAASHTFRNLTEGVHAIVVTAVDRAGNTRSDGLTVYVDTEAPTLAITAPAEGGFVSNSTLRVDWTADDATTSVLRFEIRLDQEPAVELPGSVRTFSFGDVADGAHSVTLVAFDEGGNEVTASRRLTVDATDPVLSIETPSTGAVLTTNSVSLAWTASDVTSQVDRIEVRVDRETAHVLEAGTTSFILSGLSDGEHTAEVTVFDRAGNSRIESVTFRVDTAFLSLSGPYGVVGIGLIAALLVGLLVAAVAVTRRGRRGRPPPHR